MAQGHTVSSVIGPGLGSQHSAYFGKSCAFDKRQQNQYEALINEAGTAILNLCTRGLLEETAGREEVFLLLHL